jgi:peptidoglycan/LPS O-acetylase OafA/YrhL
LDDDPSEPRVSTILLLMIALLAPWVVHLAAPRQRALALVGVVVVFLLYGIFAENPVLRWELWAGLAAGVLTVLVLAGGAISASRPRSGRSRRPPRGGGFDDGNQPTGEI